MKNILSGILIVSMVMVFLYGCKFAADILNYYKFYSETYSILRDSGNCSLVLDQDILDNLSLYKPRLDGVTDAYDKWKLVCSMRGE
jgi:hypothetical protein